MRQRFYSTEAVILARKNIGEADRLITALTKHFGKIRVLAKGVRRITSRKRGHLEVFSLTKLQVQRGKELDLVTEAETIDNFAQIRKSLKKVSLAYYFMEVIDRTTREGAPHPQLYAMLLANLRMLKTESKLRALKTKFVYQTLTILGFWPKGKPMPDPDRKLEEVIERRLSSVRVGKKLFS